MMRGAAAALSTPASFSGRKTLPNTVVQGIRVGSWNTKPMPRRASAPSRQATVPRDGSLRPAMMRSAVDLPQPDGPEQRQELAVAHVEIEPVERHECRCRTPCRRRAAKRSARRETAASRLFPQADLGQNATQRLTSAAWWAVNSLTPCPIWLEADGAELLLDLGLLDHLDDRRAELLARRPPASSAGHRCRASRSARRRARRPPRRSARPAAIGRRVGLLTARPLIVPERTCSFTTG